MSHNVTTFLSSLDHLPNYKVGNTTKVSFFWDQRQDMNSINFPPKKQGSDCLIYLSGLTIRGLFYRQETTWTHGLTRISENTDFSLKKGLVNFGIGSMIQGRCELVSMIFFNIAKVHIYILHKKYKIVKLFIESSYFASKQGSSLFSFFSDD